MQTQHAVKHDLNRRLRACLILHPSNKSWILEKFAIRLKENLSTFDIFAEISEQPSKTADINHWMMFYHSTEERISPSTMLITHVDRPGKMNVLKRKLNYVDVGICLSKATVQELIKFGIKQKKLCYINPGCDWSIKPKKIIIGITTRIYRDMRKREDFLIKLAHTMCLDAFQFEIIGLGWEKILPHLESAGAIVHYYPGSDNYEADYHLYQTLIPKFDYFLYTGMDEGSMGFLDALSAGVPTIVTPQGFHLDATDGITHPFTQFEELLEIFQNLARERQSRINSIRHFTWDEYARKHATLWRAILRGGTNDYNSVLLEGDYLGINEWKNSRVDILQKWAGLYRYEIDKILKYLLNQLLRH